MDDKLDLIILGAGKPKKGDSPSSLKKVSMNESALDWQLNSFANFNIHNVYYMGGYEIERIIKEYPKLRFTIIPEWESGSILNTFLNAPKTTNKTIIMYSDTIFDNFINKKILQYNSDVFFCYDSEWENRYLSRDQSDIDLAEKFNLNDFNSGKKFLVEYTGLVALNAKALDFVRKNKKNLKGKSTLDLVYFLQNNHFSISSFDIKGKWAELNSNDDIARFILGTKADTLDRLKPILKKSHIGTLINFTTKDWKEKRKEILKKIQNSFPDHSLIIRSSSFNEDGWIQSNAGGFESVANIDSKNLSDLDKAICLVIKSYNENKATYSQVLIQECIKNVKISGVAFTCILENGSPYYRISLDTDSNSTSSVTSGAKANLKTFIVSRDNPNVSDLGNYFLSEIIGSIQEIEKVLNYNKLDIEFAVDSQNKLHIFQVRPITVDHSDYELKAETLFSEILKNQKKFKSLQTCSPNNFGNRAIFGNMPDWNPAEIIGIKPKPLAFSLYRKIITDNVWAIQRFEFGYRDVRSVPLLLSFSGQPYVDVRASLNSFIPAGISKKLAKKLVNVYLDILIKEPIFHDKVEFKVAFTIWTPNFRSLAKKRFENYDFTSDELNELEFNLKKITLDALAYFDKEQDSIKKLGSKRDDILKSKISKIDKIYSLIEDCKNFGTLPFAHCARLGFVARSFLNSLIDLKIFTKAREEEFLKTVKTVLTEFNHMKIRAIKNEHLKEDLIKEFGHLRPGTYEIDFNAYWEDPDFYIFNESDKENINHDIDSNFILTDDEEKSIKKILSELGSKISPRKFLKFMSTAIQKRESTKFEFSKNISCSLDILLELGEEYDIKRRDLSFLEYNDIYDLKLNLVNISELLKRIDQRKKRFLVTSMIELPTLIVDEKDFSVFEKKTLVANFITSKRVEAEIIVLGPEKVDLNILKDRIVLINQADPGYDWLFGNNIAGLITEFGGANSHMAIRSAELSLPAAIGVGPSQFEKLLRMNKIVLDCEQNIIEELN